MPTPLIEALESTRGAEDVLAIMASDQLARDPELATALEAEAAAEQAIRPRADLLRQIAGMIRYTHALISAFSSVHDLRTYVDWCTRSSFFLSTSFFSLLRSVASDAAASGDEGRRRAIRRSLATRAQFKRLVRTANRIGLGAPEDCAERLNRFPRLRDPDFHRWLEAAADMSLGFNPDASAAYRSAREFFAGAASIQMKLKEAEEAMAGGQLQVALPMSPLDAQFWYLFSPQLNERFEPLAARIAAGEVTFLAAFAELNVEAPSEGDARVVVLSAFLEHVLQAAGRVVVAEVLDVYAALLDVPTVDQRFHATLALHYGAALAGHFRAIADPRPTLERAVERLGQALALIDPVRSPRLARDLWFTRARLNEDLGRWSRTTLETATEDLRAGLAVTGAAHEREARGRALGDLANMLRHLQLDNVRDAEVLATYEEALSCLPAGESRLPRGVVLSNFAGYLQERSFGIKAVNQERALSLIQEAISALNAAAQNGSTANDVNGALASAYMTQGNVLRSRAYGERTASLDAAIESYHAGIRALGAMPHELAGLLRLNIGFGYVGRYRITKDPAFLGRAEESLVHAEEQLKKFPRLAALAQLERGLLVLDDDEPVPERLDVGLDAVRGAAAILEELGMPREIAEAQASFGLLLLRRADQSGANDLKDATQHLHAAHHQYIAVGDFRNAAATAQIEASTAMRLHALDGGRVRIEQAREALVRATALVEAMWLKLDSIDARTEVSLRFGDAYADLAWCRAALNEPMTALWESVSRAKNRELLGHVSGLGRLAWNVPKGKTDRLEHLRIQAHRAEFNVTSEPAKVRPHDSLWSEVEASTDAVQELFGKMRLLGWNDDMPTGEAIDARLRAVEEAHPDTVVADFTVSRWGTTILVRLTGGVTKVCKAPLTLARLHELLWGDEGFCTVYQRYRDVQGDEATDPQEAFGAATERLLSALCTELLGPAFGTLRDELAGSRLLIIPGALSGLPLHAAALDASDGTCLFELVRGFAYVSSVAMLSPSSRSWSVPTTVLCVLSAPEDKGAGPLLLAPFELADVATRFAARDAAVTVLASAGEDMGPSLFSKRAILLPSSIDVVDERPTPEVVRERLPGFDFVFYSGHGLSSGIVLVDNRGCRRDFTTRDLLTAPELRRAPLIHLSACENAYEDRAGAAETWSFVTGLLRRGAGFVVAGMWLVRESWSRQFTTAFQESLLAGAEPAVAVRDALIVLKRAADARGGVSPIEWAPFAGFLGA